VGSLGVIELGRVEVADRRADLGRQPVEGPQRLADLAAVDRQVEPVDGLVQFRHVGVGHNRQRAPVRM
jgi:hypothetical protein